MFSIIFIIDSRGLTIVNIIIGINYIISNLANGYEGYDGSKYTYMYS